MVKINPKWGWFITHDGSGWCWYKKMLTWLGYIDGIHGTPNIWQHHGSVMGYWVNHMSFFIFPWQAPHGMGQWASRPPRREIGTDRTMDGDMAGFGRQFMEISANPGMNWGIPCRSMQHYTANVDKTIVINHPFENCLYHLVYLWWFGGRFIIVLPTLCPIYFQAKPGIAILLGARFFSQLGAASPQKT